LGDWRSSTSIKNYTQKKWPDLSAHPQNSRNKKRKEDELEIRFMVFGVLSYLLTFGVCKPQVSRKNPCIKLGGGFKMSFIFQPENLGGNDQTVTRMFFSNGMVFNHQGSEKFIT